MRSSGHRCKTHFVCRSHFPITEMNIETGYKPLIIGANGNTLNIVGTITLFVRFGIYLVRLNSTCARNSRNHMCWAETFATNVSTQSNEESESSNLTVAQRLLLKGNDRNLVNNQPRYQRIINIDNTSEQSSSKCDFLDQFH